MVGEDEIADIVSSWTGIPVSRLASEESDRLVRLEELLHKRVIGQDEPVKAVSRAVRRARAGLKNPETTHWFLCISGAYRCGENRAGPSAGRSHVRE